MSLILFLLGLIMGLIILIKNKIIRQNTTTLSFDEVLSKNAPFVIYLRSFQDDGKGTPVPAGSPSIGLTVLVKYIGTYESYLIKPFTTHFKVISVGKPNEEFPELGASRLYLEDEEWKEKVAVLLKKSRYILMRPSNSDGLNWELNYIIKEELVHKLILTTNIGSIDNKKVREIRYNDFKSRFEDLVNIKLLNYSKKNRYIIFNEIGEPISINRKITEHIMK
ncbi:hypothetical protein [uncultured Aquimarina sp.]|uniref:hypothetical protein n=1 Tax=uncultured Aquimarina sp. TaxID=575652 RepID=UPI002614B1B2|nr:hypothetical protein [uncultured Aquimarina sp.]